MFGGATIGGGNNLLPVIQSSYASVVIWTVDSFVTHDSFDDIWKNLWLSHWGIWHLVDGNQ